jgi:hypothetical protein
MNDHGGNKEGFLAPKTSLLASFGSRLQLPGTRLSEIICI